MLSWAKTCTPLSAYNERSWFQDVVGMVNNKGLPWPSKGVYACVQDHGHASTTTNEPTASNTLSSDHGASVDITIHMPLNTSGAQDIIESVTQVHFLSGVWSLAPLRSMLYY